MKTNAIRTLLAPCALALFVATCPPLRSAPVGTAFTYQGRLTEQGQPANGSYDFRFVIRDAPAGGNPLRGVETKLAIPVRDGVFSVAIDFGSSVFDGDLRWLDIEARTNGATTFTSLTPLQPLRPTPYAIAAHSLNGTVPASQVTGSLGSAALAGLYENPVSLNSPSNHFTGDGSGLKFDGFSYTNLPFYWNVKGNAGTTPGQNFVGTLDAQPLELRVNGQRALRLEPASASPNLIGGFGGNYADAGVVGSTISGGGTPDAPNRIIIEPDRTGSLPPGFGVIGGGSGNTISGASYVTIGGGANNYVAQIISPTPDAPQFHSVIAGGASNELISASMSTISGGVFNRMRGDPGQDVRGATIGGGIDNHVGTVTYPVNEPTIAGGNLNIISQSDFASIGGGNQNWINGDATQATISGGGKNVIRNVAENATISGGFSNEVETHAAGATVGGGAENLIQRYARYAIIGGGLANGIGEESMSAVISGGEANRIWNFADHATIGGGWGNLIGSNAVDYGGGLQVVQNATIGGGRGNAIYRGADQATISGGTSNLINVFARGALIAGGRQNTLSEWCTDSVISGGISNYMGFYAIGASIGGGVLNQVWSDSFYSTISGGSGNYGGARGSMGVTVGGGLGNAIGAYAEAATIGGGRSNVIEGLSANSTIGGGSANRIDLYTLGATISGGAGNVIKQGESDNNRVDSGTIAGGFGNVIGERARAAVISGGESNQANGSYSTISGGWHNRMDVQCIGAVIAGGNQNVVGRFNNGTTISGGAGNEVGYEAHGSTIGGGMLNRAILEGVWSTIAGGYENRAGGPSSRGATVGGGLGNTVAHSTYTSTIGGGSGNVLAPYASYSTIGGGSANVVTWGKIDQGFYCTIGGGLANVINGERSKAAVISGGESNQANGPYSTVAGGRLNIAGGTNSFAAGYRAQATNDGTFVWADLQEADFASTGTNQFLIRASGGVGINTDSPQFALHVNGEAGKPGGGAWSVASDARLKKDIRPLEQALVRLLQLHGVTYEYKDPKAIHELPGQQTGMIAQEVEKVFPDWVETAPDGMRRLSIRGFEALTVEALRDLRAEKDEQIRARDTKIAAMEKRLAALEQRLAK